MRTESITLCAAVLTSWLPLMAADSNKEKGASRPNILVILADDLGETRNLAKEFPGKVTEMAQNLEQLMVKGRSTEGEKQLNDLEIRRYKKEP